jgi:hypothetical protein
MFATGLLLLTAVTIYTAAYVVYILGSIRASRTLHKNLIEAVLGTTLRYATLPMIRALDAHRLDFRWLDTTPISRVITRCTQDIRASKFTPSSLVDSC